VYPYAPVNNSKNQNALVETYWQYGLFESQITALPAEHSGHDGWHQQGAIEEDWVV
jgi:hypothetical protein